MANLLCGLVLNSDMVQECVLAELFCCQCDFLYLKACASLFTYQLSFLSSHLLCGGAVLLHFQQMIVQHQCHLSQKS
jgi:hypothetical protein